MVNEANKSGEQKFAEAEVEGFQNALGPFVVAAETTRMPMIFTDAKASDHPTIFVNDSFLSLSGYDREEVIGHNFNFLMAQSDDPEALRQVEAAFAIHSDIDPEIRFRRKDSSVFWASLFISPVRDEGGDVVQHFISFVDTTKRKQEEDRLRDLLDELNHRTQNTLATVQAIAVQTLTGAAGHALVDVFEGRILALAKAHTLLGRENWHAVNLRNLIERILQPFFLHDLPATRFSVVGDYVRLGPKPALTLAMVFHELATNAAKYGALSNDTVGHIDISWQVEPAQEGKRMRLRWQESGGPPVTLPNRKGFGSRLIQERLAQDLDGEVRLDYAPTGVACEIVMPLPHWDELRNP
jgi:PAS domain S-box-containing protein